MSAYYYTPFKVHFRCNLTLSLQSLLETGTILFLILLFRKAEAQKGAYNLHMVTSQQVLEQKEITMSLANRERSY